MDDILDKTIMGYTIEDLIMVAEMMKQVGVTPDDLKNYTDAFAQGVVAMQHMVEESFSEALELVMPDEMPGKVC